MLQDYPGFEKFRALTEKEERFGLLSQGGIGHRQQWEEALARAGLSVAGHTLRRRRSTVK